MSRRHGGSRAIVGAAIVASLSGACGGRPGVRLGDAQAGADSAAAAAALDTGVPATSSPPDGSAPDTAPVDQPPMPDAADASDEPIASAMLSLSPSKATIIGAVGGPPCSLMPLELLVRNEGGEPTGPIEASVAGARGFSLQTR